MVQIKKLNISEEDCKKLLSIEKINFTSELVTNAITDFIGELLVDSETITKESVDSLTNVMIYCDSLVNKVFDNSNESVQKIVLVYDETFDYEKQTVEVDYINNTITITEVETNELEGCGSD